MSRPPRTPSRRRERGSQPTSTTIGPIVVTIAGMTRDGDAVARTADGRRVIVERVLTGERVEIRVSPRSDRDGTCHGELLRVLEPSPHRATPGCRHFGPCGGCTWQHIDYAEQLRLKRRLCESLVREALGAGAPPVACTIAGGREGGATPWGYRSKVHFVFADRGGALVMGHFRRRSKDVLPVEECPVHDGDGNRLAFALRDELVRAGVPAAAADLRRGTARHVVARVAAHTPERALTLVVRTLDQRAARAAPLAAAAAVPDASVHLNLHEADDPYLFGPTTRTLRGRDRMRETVRGTSYLISPTAFFQTNVVAAEALVDLVLEAVPTEARAVLDLYAGVGLFALSLARRGHRVVAVEESAEAVAGGIASRRLNGIDETRCRFVANRVEEALKDPRLRLEPDVVVLDPPRVGCEPRVLHYLLTRLRPPRVVYVSCNPAALARDLVTARDLGYDADRVRPVDMFPHTPHVEAVTVLTPAGRR